MHLTGSCRGAESSAVWPCAVAVEWEPCSVAARGALAIPLAGPLPRLSVEDGGGDGSQSLGFQSIVTGWGLSGGLSPFVGESKAARTFQDSLVLPWYRRRGGWLYVTWWDSPVPPPRPF